MEEEDPFGSIIAQCKPTPSQELKFRNCPFARESELLKENERSSPSSETGGTSEELTVIVMVSLSDSSKEDSRSLLSTFIDQPSEPMNAAVDSHRPRRIDGGGDGETTAVRDCCEDAERAVDLGKDSDNLGFSKPKPKKFGDSKSESSEEPLLKKSRVLDENLGLKLTEPNVDVIETEIIESEFEDSLAQTIELLTENTEIVNVDDVVTAGECATMRENVGGEPATENSPAMKKEIMKDLIDGLKMVEEEIDCCEGTDFLETAKKRGMIFPRPRWWPPEGFGD